MNNKKKEKELGQYQDQRKLVFGHNEQRNPTKFLQVYFFPYPFSFYLFF